MKITQTNTTGTEFAETTTQHGDNENGGVPPLMSEAGKKLAAKTAPASALQNPFESRRL
jgi:hypothetical protein